MTSQPEIAKPKDDDTPPSTAVAAGPSYAVDDSRKIGVVGATLLILNKMVGTGIFSTPSSIFASSGSVGFSIILWVLGGVISACGLSVYLEYGLAIPKSGGEKNYLERVYRRPRYLSSCVLAAQMILTGFSTGNALAFGHYVLLAAGQTHPPDWTARGIGIACITSAVLLHSCLPRCGVWANNVLGVFKIAILALIVFTGFHVLIHPDIVGNPGNFKDAMTFHTGVYNGVAWGAGGASAYATALLRVIFSYKGWENANYIVGELKNPKRTLAIAGPVAISIVTFLYVLTNVAFFAAVPKEVMATSDVIVAGVFFRNVFGDNAGARVLPAIVSLSNLGNVLAVSFAHARVNQEFGKEGLLPFSPFWASMKPFGAPAASFFLHWLITVIMLVAPPPGPAYSLVVDLYAYPGTWINTFVAAGLIYLRFSKRERWSSPFRSWLPVTALFLVSNVFLALVPFVPPPGSWTANGYPYYVFPVVGIMVLLLGVVYWVFWARVVPRVRGYKLTAERTVDEEGIETLRYRKVRRRRVEDEEGYYLG